MRILALVILVLMSAQVLRAQQVIGAAAEGAGGTALLSTNPWAAYNNQGALAFTNEISAGAWYRNRFLTEGMADQAFAFALPVRQGTFGLSVHSFGDALFRRTQAGLSYGMKMSEKFAAGVGLGYQQIAIAEGYGSSSSILVSAGFLYRMNQKLSLAGQLQNINRDIVVTNPEERAPSVLKAGARYTFSEKVSLTAEVWKPENIDLGVHAGIEYWPADNVVMLAGVVTNPSLFSFGFGWKKGGFRMDVASSYHQVLGFSPQLALNYAFGER
jgi:hypothetical protein